MSLAYMSLHDVSSNDILHYFCFLVKSVFCCSDVSSDIERGTRPTTRRGGDRNPEQNDRHTDQQFSF